MCAAIRKVAEMEEKRDKTAMLMRRSRMRSRVKDKDEGVAPVSEYGSGQGAIYAGQTKTKTKTRQRNARWRADWGRAGLGLVHDLNETQERPVANQNRARVTNKEGTCSSRVSKCGQAWEKGRTTRGRCGRVCVALRCSGHPLLYKCSIHEHLKCISNNSIDHRQSTQPFAPRSHGSLSHPWSLAGTLPTQTPRSSTLIRPVALCGGGNHARHGV
ncbi:hypothetical protein K461DRAFT_303171 [Myriangium duriaei CBS 260.36]|uniref:Uncharacterized protein n=1 Tax=Myriangium duriaei CBS 260.36 TaxID=1168546 RepID=A0A9P4J9J5_9PEZI|nr:hypothetical protein K461DRAFT_303171 [Myriangium duriaei CBS 260.36]